VVIVEAAEKSGALITADAALDQNREIFAIPGSIFQKTSAGTNNLIKTTAAKLISSAEDIIIEFPELIRSRKTVNPEQVTTELSLIEREILKNIGAEPVALEQLLARVKITPAALAGNLILLEMKNKIRAIGGNFYARTQSAT
jgi:DNA processing protein